MTGAFSLFIGFILLENWLGETYYMEILEESRIGRKEPYD